MARHLAAAIVVVADTLLLTAAHHGLPAPVLLAYALAAASVVSVQHHQPVPAMAATLLLATLTGGSYLLLIAVGYRAGHSMVSRVDGVLGTAAVVASAAAAITAHPGTAGQVVAGHVVFVVLPLLVGRYLAEHKRMVTALDERNRHLRRERELLAEREQLRERMRIARDMHDSLGHRLSLVSVQAAALEVADLPPEQRQAVASLAGSTRAAVAELYELIGSLRGAVDEKAPGTAAIGGVVDEFRAAGVPVVLETSGGPRPLPAAADTAAYRVVEEGLTNAAKHAPDRPVTVRIAWESDALVLSVTNPLAEVPTAVSGAGNGLAGLRERIQPAGGFVDHRTDADRFHLVAMLPTGWTEPAAEDTPRLGRVRVAALTAATAVVLFGLLPASLLAGVG